MEPVAWHASLPGVVATAAGLIHDPAGNVLIVKPNYRDLWSLPDGFVRDIRNYDSRSGVVKVNLAISELPEFRAYPGKHVQAHHSGAIELAHSMDYTM